MHLFRHSFVNTLSGVCAAMMSLGAMAPGAALAADQSATPKQIRIGVIGAGWLGGTVGSQWAKAGYEVKFSSRHPDELKSMTSQLGPNATVGTPREAAEFGNVILIAVPYSALPQIGQDLNDQLRGKIVLDATNAPGFGGGSLTREASEHGVGVTSAKYLPGTRLVRAFSAVDATAVEASAGRQQNKLGVPLASDDAEAMKVAEKLVVDAGCEPVVVGNLAAGRVFERAGAGFRANTTAPELRRAMGMK
jgi:predicted dinucleotide-binding enzyme